MGSLKNDCVLTRRPLQDKRDQIIPTITKMVKERITVRDQAIRIQGFSMSTKFNSLPWHDAELLSINVDRSNAGNSDTVSLVVKWPDGNRNSIVFSDCYLLDAKMNFGVVAEESILEAICFDEGEKISEVKGKWQPLGVKLDSICCYRIITNSTNSQIDIYALSYALS